MAGGRTTSKNQRSVKPQTGPYTEVGDSNRIVPLGAGFCYLRDPRDGRTIHVKVDSDRFRQLVEEIATHPSSARLGSEFDRLAADAHRHGDHWVRAREWYRTRSAG